MLAIVIGARWFTLYYRGDHRKPPTYGFAARHAFTAWLTVATVAIATAILAAWLAPGANAATMHRTVHCTRVARNVTVCVTGRAPQLFELQCESMPHHPMQCEYRSK